MAVNYHGEDGLILSHSGEVVQDIYGEQFGSCLWRVPPERWDLMPGAGAVHPYAKWMVFEVRRVRFTPGFWEVNCDYRGVDGTPPPQYELVRGSGEEAIETHPDFESKIAGKPSAPKNGAIFVDGRGEVTVDDDLGVFDRFKLSSDLKGVEGYLEMTNVTWVETWVSKTVPTDGGKVKIETPPGGAPSYEGMKWLYTGMSSSGVRGGSCKNKKTWRLGQWKEIIYGES